MCDLGFFLGFFCFLGCFGFGLVFGFLGWFGLVFFKAYLGLSGQVSQPLKTKP